MQQIRITKTTQLEKVLSQLKEKYQIMSEVDIIKMALSDFYYRETQQTRSISEILKEFAKNPKAHSIRKKTDKQYKNWWNETIKPDLK